MKKRIIAVSLIVTFIVILLCGCGHGGKETYKYSHATATSYGSDYEFKETVEFVYSDTNLKLYEDGTWCIDTPVFLFFNMKIDKGTYEIDSTGRYVFDGFEYGLSSYGTHEGNTFKIYFVGPASTNYATIMTLYYTM